MSEFSSPGVTFAMVIGLPGRKVRSPFKTIDIFCEWIDELERDNQRGSDDDDEKSSSEEEDEHDRWEARNSRA